ncbi:KxYKxGKxW signal peptide domain-containing protein [Limosilactobacillus pontis]|uniref:KxYKxGKxW signal peptide domain-containing protein n=1 Tax=Limosilactobacillus pontis TaxID=35787 RepID=UPI00070F781F|nr:KxYKxGKxW signal peptide domain-containing protein [Limosilactobacillus pontis]
MEKKHFKLFKAGRRWCVVAIAMLSAMAIGTTTNADVANKDDASVVMTTQSGNNSNRHSEIADNSAAAVSNTSTEQRQTIAATPSTQINENNQWTYYTNGKVQAGRNYVNLPTINGQGNS